LALRIEPSAIWQDSALPGRQVQILRNLATHFQKGIPIRGQQGFATNSTGSIGLSTLFIGASCTGKTLAAEVLANELKVDLFRIDLSLVFSKNIGETEKNLKRVFDKAADSGAILLFDWADTLFGGRSEVKDNYDRYTNIEIGYLLELIEAFRGAAILATNMKSSLDNPFYVVFALSLVFRPQMLRQPAPAPYANNDTWQSQFNHNPPLPALATPLLFRLNRLR
jgi:hypothetical protein